MAHDVLDLEEHIGDLTYLGMFFIEELLVVFVFLLDLGKDLEVSFDYLLDLGEVHVGCVLLEDVRLYYATNFVVEPLQDILDCSGHTLLTNFIDVSLRWSFG